MGQPYAEVIGDPIAHSKSPLIHRFWLEKLGLDCAFRQQRVTSNELSAHLAKRRHDPLWRGASITIPHKQAAITEVDELSGPAAAIGAMNAVIRRGAEQPKLLGYNTDAPGFLDTLLDWKGLGRTYQTAHVIGTGGAAAAVAWTLREQGFLVFVYSRSDARGEAFLKQVGEDDMDFVQQLSWLTKDSPGDVVQDEDSADILINASPLGMRGFPPLDINFNGFQPNMLVYDLVYDPVETPLLRAAREWGHPTRGGLDMLIAQAAFAFVLFFATQPPREHDDELRALLTQ